MTAGVSIGGVGLEASQGYSSANVYSTEIGTSSQYEGSVAGISANDPNFNSDRYSVGLIVYNFNRTSAVKYTVIDYCTSQP